MTQPVILRAPGSGLDALAQLVRETAPGQRNAILAWSTWTAAEEGFSDADILAALVPAGVEAGLPEREARYTVRMGIRRVERKGARGSKARQTDWRVSSAAWQMDPAAQAEVAAILADAAADLAAEDRDLIVGIEAYRDGVPASPLWIADRFVYAGGTTLLSGPPKKGKSTFSADLQRKRETGGHFLHAGVLPGPTLLLTEEGGVAVVHKTQGLQQLDILDRRSAVRAELDWPGTLGVVARWAADNQTEHGRPLVFIDTLAIWAGVEEENDAGEMTRALAGVQLVAQETDAGIVVVHHTRKGGGTGGEAIRGSSAILATVDMSAELSTVEEGSTDRWLDVQGRVIFPERLRLAFDMATMSYSVVDADAVRLEDVERDLEHVPAVGTGDGLTRADLSALWGRDSRKRIAQLVNIGRMTAVYRQVGRTHQWRYWAVPPAGPTGRGREDD